MAITSYFIIYLAKKKKKDLFVLSKVSPESLFESVSPFCGKIKNKKKCFEISTADILSLQIKN